MIYLPKRNKVNVDANINIVPYIDVMLVLLVIFMITTPILEQGIEVDLTVLNKDVVVEDLIENDPVIVSMDKNGYFYIGESKNPATLEQIIVEIEEEGKINPNLVVAIKPDKMANIGRYIELLTFIQKNTSIKKVGIIGK